MENRYPHAIRLIRTHCTDGLQERAFNDWYDRVHVPEVLSSGTVTHVIRYKNGDPEDAGPGYLAVHELAAHDLEAVAHEVVRMRRRLTASRGFPAALRIVRAESWKMIGPRFPSEGPARAMVAGILVIESRCTDPRREQEFNAWYEDDHIPDLLDTGLFVAAYRFASVAAGALIGADAPAEGAPVSAEAADGARYLAIYETAADPLEAVREFSRAHRPRLNAAGRLSDIIEVTWQGIYRQLRPASVR